VTNKQESLLDAEEPMSAESIQRLSDQLDTIRRCRLIMQQKAAETRREYTRVKDPEGLS